MTYRFRWLFVAALWLSSASVAIADPPTPAPLSAADERDRRYEERFRAVEQKFAAVEKGIETALTVADRLLDQRFSAQEKALQAALLAVREAVDKADIANTKKFDSVNEFRGQLKDQAATLLPRTEFEALKKDLDSVKSRQDQIVGAQLALASARTDSQGSWGIVVGAAGVVVAIISIAIAFVISRRALPDKIAERA